MSSFAEIRREVLGQLQLTAVIPGLFQSASGATLWHKCEIPPLLASNLALANGVGQLLLDYATDMRLWQERSLCVGGKTEGARSLVHSMRLAMRNSPQWRDYGLEEFILERDGRISGGRVPNNQPILVVEDVLTSARSALEAVAALRRAGGQVGHVAALIARKEQGLQVLAPYVKPHVIFRFSEVLAPELHHDIEDLY